MRKTILAASLVLPLLVLACNRNEPAPTSAIPAPEKQAMSPDKMLERSPPAAGTPTAPSDTQSTPVWQPSTPASPPSAAGTADSKPSEPLKSGY